MRMWMIDPKLLCRKHLLGEHGEIHKFRHNFVKKHKMNGRMGQISPTEMETRHDEIAVEMVRRGYNHQSPYEQPDVSYLPEMSVNKQESLRDLSERCEDCRGRINESFSHRNLHKNGTTVSFKNLSLENKIMYCYEKYFTTSGFTTGEMCIKINEEANCFIAMMPDVYDALKDMNFINP